MEDESLPVVCPRCGSGRVVRILWDPNQLSATDQAAVDAGRVILDPAMANPTVVVLTDRNDLDGQLFGTFARCQDLLRQAPEQAASRADLREKLRVGGGGVVFTTIQKFFPEERGDAYPLLSDRRNIVVIADEAHRSQYGFGDQVDPKTGERTYGFAKYLRDALPRASFIAFTQMTESSAVRPPSTQSTAEMRAPSGTAFGTTARTARSTSSGNVMRPSSEPP